MMASRTIHMGPVDYLTNTSHGVGLPLASPSMRHFPTGTGSMGVEETHKGQWTPHEDDILRHCAQRRNANPTACSASRCLNECAECFCVHHHCSPDHCLHSQCNERDCLRPDAISQWPRPVGSLVMRPLSDTLCRHLTSTDKPWTEIAGEVSQQTGPGKKRNAKQCRERWFQQLRPGLLHQPITEEEGSLIMDLVERHGNKWADISRDSKLERRSDNWIKNWFNSSGNKKERAKHGVARSVRQTSGSPQGIQRPRAHHHHAPSAAALNQMYNYAAEYAAPPIRSPRSPPYHHSPTYSHSSYPFPAVNHHQQTSPSTLYDHWEPTHYPTYSHPSQYHNRRRESTLSVNTASSMAQNGSGPSTPSTSVSLTFPSMRDSKSTPPAAQKPVAMPHSNSSLSSRDPRMTIGSLCG